MQNGKIEFPAPLVAVANWLVPGAGYLMIGQTARGLTIGFTIITLFVLGILIGGIHVIDPPVFTPGIGNAVQLFTHKASAVLVKPAYIGQFLTGAIGLIGSWIGPSQPSSHARANDIGTLYTAIYNPQLRSVEYRWPNRLRMYQSFAFFEEYDVQVDFA